MKYYFYYLRADFNRVKNLWIGLRRLRRNICPACNSDGPYIDTCYCCKGWRYELLKDNMYNWEVLLNYIKSFNDTAQFRRYK